MGKVSDVLDRLEDALRPADVPEDAEGNEEWRVTDRSSAAYASRKVARALRSIAEIKAWEKAEIERVKAVAAIETRRLQGTVDFFQGHLGAYLQGLIRAGQKAKSLLLPGGRIKITGGRKQIELPEPEAFIAWAKSAGHADLVRVKEEVNKDQLNRTAQLAEGGQVLIGGDPIPNATWAPTPEKYGFELAAEEAESEGDDDG